MHRRPQLSKAAASPSRSRHADLSKRCASDVDQIFRGAIPGNIPFYQTSKFELSVNLPTASRLRLSVPAPLAARADLTVE
jgi:putative ABC transport system substrate-binding protein